MLQREAVIEMLPHLKFVKKVFFRLRSLVWVAGLVTGLVAGLVVGLEAVGQPEAVIYVTETGECEGCQEQLKHRLCQVRSLRLASDIYIMHNNCLNT